MKIKLKIDNFGSPGKKSTDESHLACGFERGFRLLLMNLPKNDINIPQSTYHTIKKEDKSSSSSIIILYGTRRRVAGIPY